MRSGARVLARIHGELAEFERRRSELDRAIARLRRVAVWLERRAERRARVHADEDAPQSITDWCRAVLRMSTVDGLTPREVKRLLTDSGFVWERFTNPMSAVHTVLKRLVRQQEAVTMIGRDGKRRFAVKPRPVVALTCEEVDDREFLKKLLGANSPDDTIALIKERRTKDGD